MARQYVDIKIHEPSLKSIDEKYTIRYDLKNPAIESIHTTTPLNFAFFSKDNIDAVQNALRYQVWIRTNKKHIIGRQSTGVPEQVQELNNIVIEYLIPQVISQVEQYIAYLRDISNPYVIMDRAKNTSVVGEKSFNMARFI